MRLLAFFILYSLFFISSFSCVFAGERSDSDHSRADPRRDRQARRSGLSDTHGRGPDDSARAGPASGDGAAAGRQRARRRLRPVQGADPADRVQRPAYRRRDAGRDDLAQRSIAGSRLRILRDESESRAGAEDARRTREGRRRIRAAGIDPRARGDSAEPEDHRRADARRDARRRLLPQYRDRSDRRLQSGPGDAAAGGDHEDRGPAAG